MIVTRWAGATNDDGRQRKPSRRTGIAGGQAGVAEQVRGSPLTLRPHLSMGLL
jgi:hypothetical protein